MKHDWIALVTYGLSEAEAAHALVAETKGVAAEPPILLNAERTRHINVGCYRCEQVGKLDLIGTECPGGPS